MKTKKVFKLASAKKPQVFFPKGGVKTFFGLYKMVLFLEPVGTALMAPGLSNLRYFEKFPAAHELDSPTLPPLPHQTSRTQPSSHLPLALCLMVCGKTSQLPMSLTDSCRRSPSFKSKSEQNDRATSDTHSYKPRQQLITCCVISSLQLMIVAK